MNFVETTERVCKENTLLEALTFICIWESARIVKQARYNEQWETCFNIFIKKCYRTILGS